MRKVYVLLLVFAASVAQAGIIFSNFKVKVNSGSFVVISSLNQPVQACAGDSLTVQSTVVWTNSCSNNSGVIALKRNNQIVNSQNNFSTADSSSYTALLTGGLVVSGTYTLYATQCSGGNQVEDSTTAVSFQLTVNAKPTASPAATPSSICNGGSTTLAANAAAGSGTISAYTWSSGLGNVASGPVSPGSSTTYNVTVSNSNGCSVSASVAVTVNTTPVATVTNSNSPICSGQSFTTITFGTSNGVGGTTFAWSRNNTGTVTGIAASGSGNIAGAALANTTLTTQTVTFTITPTGPGPTNCVGSNITTTLVVNPGPTMTSANADVICSGGTVVIPLTSNIASSYTWQAANNANITGESTSPQNTDTLRNTLTNTSNTQQTVTYTVTPTATSGSCPGSAQTVTITVDAKPSVLDQTGTVCSGQTFNASISNGGGNIVPAGTTYSWAAPNVTGGLTGGTAQSGQTSMSQTLVNPTNTTQTATYTITPVSGSCTGNTFTATVTVKPKPVIADVTTAICNGTAFTVSPQNGVPGANIVPSGTTYSWPAPTTSASFTGDNPGNNQTSVSQTLTHQTTSSQTATYTVTPVANGCTGNDFQITVTVNPKPVVPNQTITVCNAEQFSFTPQNSPPGTIVPAGTTYSWGLPAGSPTGGTTGTDVASVTQTLFNSSGSSQNATYSVVPKVSGCTGSVFNLTATVIPSPVQPQISYDNTHPVCAGAKALDFQLNETQLQTVNYQWVVLPDVPVAGETGRNAKIDFPSAGTFKVMVAATVSGGGCTKRDTVSVTVTNSSAPLGGVIRDSLTLICTNNQAASYQWGYDSVSNLKSVSLTNETNQDYLASSNPDTSVSKKYYWVIITDSGGCQSKIYYQSPPFNKTRDEENPPGENVFSVRIYPNPFGDDLHVTLEHLNSTTLELSLCDIEGRVVLRNKADASSGNVTVYAGNLSRGVYLLRLAGGTVWKKTIRLVKQ